MKYEPLATINGVVKRFAENGRKLGYPTANLSVPITLGDGVYFGFADLGSIKNNPALIFVGTPTTVGGTKRRVEAHLLDVKDTDYYGEKLELQIMKYYRPSETFESVSKLIIAMKADEVAGRDWFSNVGNIY